MALPLRASAQPAAIGLRTHSGWAVAVVLTGTGESPRVVSRQRIELITEGTPKQPYHAAQALSMKKAEALIARATEAVHRQAQAELGAIIREARIQGYAFTGAGVLLASGRPLGTLEQTLASHAAIHTAEGELFRQAVMAAAKHCGVPVIGVKERELFDRATETLGKPAAALRQALLEMGSAVGRPWGMDEKLSALVAWLVLASPRLIDHPN